MLSWLDCSWHVERMYTPAENNTKKGKESSKVALPDCETRVEWPSDNSYLLYTLYTQLPLRRRACAMQKKEDGVCRHSVLAAITYLSSSGMSVIKSTDIVKMFWIWLSSFEYTVKSSSTKIKRGGERYSCGNYSGQVLNAATIGTLG